MPYPTLSAPPIPFTPDDLGDVQTGRQHRHPDDAAPHISEPPTPFTPDDLCDGQTGRQHSHPDVAVFGARDAVGESREVLDQDIHSASLQQARVGERGEKEGTARARCRPISKSVVPAKNQA